MRGGLRPALRELDFERAALALLGGVLGALALRGTTNLWVTQPTWVLCATAGLIVLLAVCPEPKPEEECHSEECCPNTVGHAHTHPDAAGPAAVAVVIILAAIITPPALRPAQVTDATRWAATVREPTAWPDLPEGVPALNLMEFVARSAAPADSRLAGREAQLRGTLERHSGELRLRRVVIFCCAADARSYTVALDDPSGRAQGFADGDPLLLTVGFIPGSGTEETGWIPTATVRDAAYDADQAAYERNRR